MNSYVKQWDLIKVLSCKILYIGPLYVIILIVVKPHISIPHCQTKPRYDPYLQKRWVPLYIILANIINIVKMIRTRLSY